MFRAVFSRAATLLAVIAAPLSAAADDRGTCADWNNEQAVAACSRLMNQNPNDPVYFTNRGHAYWAKQDYDRAIKDYEQALRLDPKYAAAYSGRGNVYYAEGDNDRAIADYDEAIRLNPNFAVAYANRGNSYNYGKSDYDRALSDYDQAIRLDSKYTLAFRGRGYAYEKKGDYDRAIADYDQAIRLDPKNASAYNLRGNVYHDDKHDYDRAIAEYDQAVRLDPAFAVAYSNRGNAYNYGKHDYERAVSDYDQAIRLDPNFTLAYRNRGYAYEKKGDYDRAISDYDHAIQLDPRNASASNLRGNAYYDGKHDYDRAISDYDQAIRLDPKFAVAYSNRGNAYNYGKRDYGRAIADYDQAIRLDPKNTLAYGNRGDAYEKKGDYVRAAADYEQALKLDPNYAAARDGRTRVQAAAAARPSPAPPIVAAPVSAERRVALVIGNSGYTSPLVSALPNPRRDAGLVADGLRQAGFDTTELTDLDRTGMVRALQAFRAKADGADWALVYFAGHGIEINRVNYLIPVDARLATTGDVELETVSYDAVQNAMGGARALRIVVLDACRNNPFKANMRQTTALRGSLDRGLAPPPETEPGTVVVYSAKEGQTAVDGEGVNSPFARAFVTRIRTPGRELRRLFDDVRDDVIAATGRQQQPYTYGSLPGGRDFFFTAGR